MPRVFGVALISGIAYVIPLATVRDHLQTRASDIATVRDRQAIDSAALHMVVLRPFFGFGWGRFQPLEFNYIRPSDGYSLWNRKPNPCPQRPCDYQATDLGLVGASMWLLILLIGIGGAVLSRRRTPDLQPSHILVGALSVMSLVAGLTAPLSSSFQSLIIWLLAALVVGGANACYEPSPSFMP